MLGMFLASLFTPRASVRGLSLGFALFAHSSFYECICLQILDDEECSLPEVDALRFVGMEGQGELSTSPKLIRRKVEEDMQSHLELLKSICLAKSVEFQSLRTSDDLGLALHRFIGLRSRKK